MRELEREIRLSATISIIGITLFVVLITFGPASMTALEVTLRDPFLDSGRVEDPFSETSLLAFFVSVLVPLLLMAFVTAMESFMRHKGLPLARWLQRVGITGLAIWVISGGVLLILVRAAEDVTQIDSLDLAYTWLMLAYGLFDIAYLVLSIYSLVLGWVLLRAKYETPGWTAIFSGFLTMLFILLGPYENLNFFVIFSFGAPIYSFFTLSAFLLLEADKLVDTPTHPV